MAQVFETNPKAGGFIVSEGSGSISRDSITVLSGENLAAGAVLGKITASGKFVELDPGGAGGAEVAVAVLYDAVDASAADAPGVAITRLAEVNQLELVWITGITGPQTLTAEAELALQYIIARSAA